MRDGTIRADWISSAEAVLLEAEAGRAEQLGQLTVNQLKVLSDRKLFKIFVPEEWDGLSMDLPSGLRLQEQLAYLDGSLGWTVTLCSGASWFVGFLDPVCLPAIFSDANVCFGGSGMATGTAELTRDGYHVNGFWKYATGAPHNTIFTANCRVMQDGRELPDEDGNVRVVSFYFTRDEVNLIRDWQTMGLKATASHSFSVQDLHVDFSRTFEIRPDRARIDDPIYRFPFVQFAEATLAVNYLGMFRRFMDLAEANGILAAAEERRLLDLRASRLYQAVDRSWDAFSAQNSQEPEALPAISTGSRQLVKEGLLGVTRLYPQLGIRAADPAQPINRLWRDLFTASQHMIFR